MGGVDIVMGKLKKAIRTLYQEGFWVFRYKMQIWLGSKSGNKGSIQYEKWIKNQEKDILNTEALEYNPMISVVIPVYNVSSQILTECIESVLNQTYTNWQLCLAEDHSTWTNVRECLKKYEDNPAVSITYRKENGNISRATNTALGMAKGEFIAFMDSDDTLSPNALYEVAKKLNEDRSLDFIYSDEDKLDESGKRRYDPHFKPDWSPDTLMSMMYTSHLGVYRASLVKELGGLRPEYDGAQDYDFTLRFTEKTDRIAHIPKILYHWRAVSGSTAEQPEAKEYVFDAAKRAKEEALKRRGCAGKVEFLPDLFQWNVIYAAEDKPKVSIIIPSKDNYEVYERCIETLHDKTLYPDYEVIHVDNGSSEDNRKKYGILDEKYHQTYYYYREKFNFAKMCNIGASLADGTLLLFLNDDIEVIQPDWLDIMAGHGVQNHIGAVGAKLYYTENKIIQHCGVVNLAPGPAHIFTGRDDRKIYYYGRNRLNYNLIAVTGACLLVRRELFERLGGFDTAFPVAFNDVDFCYSLLEHGYYNVIRNDAVLYHHESASRGEDSANPGKKKRWAQELTQLCRKHPEYQGRDPFYSINFSPFDLNCSINTEWTEKYNKKLDLDAECLHEEKNLVAAVESFSKAEEILLQGYACFKNRRYHGHRRARLLLEGEKEKICLETAKVYRSDLQGNVDVRGKVGMAGFECHIDPKRLTEKKYFVRVILDGALSGVLETISIRG